MRFLPIKFNNTTDHPFINILYKSFEKCESFRVYNCFIGSKVSYRTETDA